MKWVIIRHLHDASSTFTHLRSTWNVVIAPTAKTSFATTIGALEPRTHDHPVTFIDWDVRTGIETLDLAYAAHGFVPPRPTLR